MPKSLLLILLIVASAGTVFAQDTALYQKKVYIHKRDTMPYRLLLPQNYNTRKKYPLILFLHGSGEKGKNNTAQLIHGGDLFIRDSIRKKYPAIVLIPQCPRQSNWVDDKRVRDATGKYRLLMLPDADATAAMKQLEKLVRAVKHTYRIDSKRIYVGGLSLGGMGTYDIVRRNPRFFAAAFPICGAADSSIVPRLRHANWWIFHGENDNAVSPDFDKKIVLGMNKLNIPVKFTLYPNTGHNSWDKAFDEPGLFSWLFSNSKKRSL